MLIRNHDIMDKFVQRLGPAKARQDNPSPGQAEHRTRHEPPAKRVKREIPDSDEEDLSAGSSDANISKRRNVQALIQREDTTAAGYDDGQSELESHVGRPTAIESSLPEVKLDEEAIEEYETFRASQGEQPADTASRFIKREWVKGKSSLYVDAFNLALGTVLDDESHLFDAKERSLFDSWESLGYDAQYL